MLFMHRVDIFTFNTQMSRRWPVKKRVNGITFSWYTRLRNNNKTKQQMKSDTCSARSQRRRVRQATQQHVHCEPGFVKSNLLAIALPFPSSSGEDNFRFLLILPFLPTFPSTSARGGVSSFLKHFGSFEGCVGKGRAKKYGCSRA